MAQQYYISNVFGINTHILCILLFYYSEHIFLFYPDEKVKHFKKLTKYLEIKIMNLWVDFNQYLYSEYLV